MDGNIAATYTLIHRFLKQQSQNKAAAAVKKAAKDVVVLGDDIEHQGPPLEDIIKEWKARQRPTPNLKDADADSSSESSDVSSSDSEDGSDSDSVSEDTSSSESEDDDTSDGNDKSDKGTGTIQLPRKGVERDTSVTLSSAGENTRVETTQVIEETVKKSSSSESDSSDSDDSDSDSSTSNDSDAEKSSASDSSSDSDSSEEDKSDETEKVLPDTTKITENKIRTKEDAPAAKKRKMSENGAAVTTAVAAESRQTTRPMDKKEKPPTKTVERFQRVKAQHFTHEQLLDNGYEARGGKTDDYGQRAHRDLVVTRGAGFRKEKNKKKRGSYRGGEITMENHSIRFDS